MTMEGFAAGAATVLILEGLIGALYIGTRKARRR